MTSPFLQKFGIDNFKGEYYKIFFFLPIPIFLGIGIFYFIHKKGEMKWQMKKI